jgi:hypothetical protein
MAGAQLIARAGSARCGGESAAAPRLCMDVPVLAVLERSPFGGRPRRGRLTAERKWVMGLDGRLAGRWTPAELGVHLVAGGGPLPGYAGGPLDERLRVRPASPAADGRLVVVGGEPGTGTSRAGWEAVAGVLAGWPLEDPRTAAVPAMAGCIKRHAVASAWLSGGDTPAARPGVAACTAGPSRGGAGTARGPVAAWCGGARRRLTDAR